MRTWNGRRSLHRRWVILGTMACLLIVSGCSDKVGAEERLVFMAGYKPQANLPFVGVYVAQAQGYFAEEGLTVEIQHSAGGAEHLQLLVAGKVDVTTQDAAVLLQRRADPGLPLVSIAMIGQRGQQAYVALAESGIESLADWGGQRVGYKGTPPPDLFALLDVAGLTPDDVQMINVGFDPRVLVEGLVDIYPVFLSNEPFTLQSWGYDINTWAAADYGVHTLGLAYVTSEEIIEEKPEALEKFTRAALRGITYAEAHRDEAIDIVMTYTGPEADPALMRYMLDTEFGMARNAVTNRYGLGWQTFGQWYNLLDTLAIYGAMDRQLDVNRAFTTDFLPQE